MAYDPNIQTDAQGNTTVAGGLQAGSPEAASQPDDHTLFGVVNVQDVPGSVADGDLVMQISQSQAQQAGSQEGPAFVIHRSGSVALGDYTSATLIVNDETASARPVVQVFKQGTAVLELTTRKSITGALSAVTDPAAKDVLTSLVAALTGIKVATDNTT